MTYQIYNKSCLVLPDIADNSIDAIVTDPPYGINFQGQLWDKSLPDTKIWKNCFRVLKLGGFLLSFSSIILMHKLICQIETYGFEMKDILFWANLNGMPKSRNLALDIDKELNIESEAIGEYKYVQGYRKDKPQHYSTNVTKYIKEPTSNLAKSYKGAGISLKPAYEPIVMLQKPISESNIAKNIIKWGTGALNLENSRIPYGADDKKVGHNPHLLGRVPSNIIRNYNFGDGYDKFFVIPKVRKKEQVIQHPTQNPKDLTEFWANINHLQ